MNNYPKKKLPHYQRIDLKELYDLNAFENLISNLTMDFHYNILHLNYEISLEALNLGEKIEAKYHSLEELIENLENLPAEVREEVRFFGGGLLNHNLFFRILKKDAEEKVDPKFLELIQEYLNREYFSANPLKKGLTDLEKLKEKLIESALKVRGSGWAWLVLNKQGKLQIINTQNQDNPLSLKLRPLIGIDVWEHAYILDYRSKSGRKDYVKNLVNRLLNWEYISEIYLTYEAT